MHIEYNLKADIVYVNLLCFFPIFVREGLQKLIVDLYDWSITASFIPIVKKYSKLFWLFYLSFIIQFN